jgi:hypothetical protein
VYLLWWPLLGLWVVLPPWSDGAAGDGFNLGSQLSTSSQALAGEIASKRSLSLTVPGDLVLVS